MPSDPNAYPCHIYVDGSYSPAEGRGGWGFVAYMGPLEIRADNGPVCGGDNGNAELVALLNAITWLAALKPRCAAIVFSDSSYVVNGCNIWRSIWRNNGWRRSTPNGKGRRRAVPNADLWRDIDVCLTENPHVTVEWCKGHADIHGNIRADALASEGWRHG